MPPLGPRAPRNDVRPKKARVRRPKPATKAPSPAKAAKAKEQQYKSQGEQVEKTANRQRKETGRLHKRGTEIGVPHNPAVVAANRQNVLRQSLKSAGKGVSYTYAAPGLRLMKESTRPLHGSAATAKALVEGKDIKKAAEAGAHAFVKNEGTTYSDVLKSAGVKNKKVRAVGGFLLDMVADPTTGARLRRLAPKQALEQKAAGLEAKAAQAGRTKKIKGVVVKPSQPGRAQRLTKRAGKTRAAAAKASESRGVQVGYDAKIPFGPRVTAMTKGRVSSKVGKKLAPAGEKARGSRVAEAGRAAFSPTARKPGETEAERQAFVYQERLKRARENEARRKAQRRGTAHARAASKMEVPQDEMIAGVERAAKDPLLATRRVKRKAPAHRAVVSAERRVRTAKAKLQKEQGRAEILREQARKTKTPFQAPARLVKAQQEAQAAEQHLVATTALAQAVPKYEKYLIDVKTGQRYEDFKKTAPVHTPQELPAKAQQVARATEKELEGLKVRQQQAGVLEGERSPYYPHRVIPEPKTVGGAIHRKLGGKPGHTKKRQDVRPIAEQEAERAAKGQAPLFSTAHGATMAHYTKAAETGIARSQHLQGMKAAGKPLTASNWAKRRPTDALYKITPTGIQEVKRPSGKALSDSEIHALIAKGEDATIVPRSRGDAEVAARAGGRDEQTKRALRIVNKPMQIFKTAATVLNIPYYHERNFMDDSYRSWASGATANTYKDATKLVKDQSLLERRQQTQLEPTAVQRTVAVAGREMPREKFLKEAQDDGALRTGFFAGSDLPEEGIKPATGLRRLRPVQKIREYGQNFEDVPKLAAYKAARDRGLTRAEAAQHMRIYMFDYDELTPIEQAIRGTLVPFYTYAKKNTVLQTRLFLTQPGKISAIQKLREEFNKYGADDIRYRRAVSTLMPLLQSARKQGLVSQQEIDGLRSGNFESLLTETDQRGFPTLGPDGNLMYMPLGITDTNRIPFATAWEAIRRLPGQQFDLAMQMIGPQKLPLEIGQNYSFFFRDAIYRSQREPDAERWVPAPGWAKTAGIPTTKREVNGKTVQAWPAWLDYSIRSMGPQLGMLANVGNPTANSRGQTTGDMLRKQLSGIRSAQFDDRLLAGLQERVRKRLGDVTVELRDRSDIPGGKGKTDEGFFFSKGYQALLDEQKALQGLRDKLRETRTGIKTAAALRLERRPLSPRQELENRIAAKRARDPRAELDRRIAKMRAKQGILRGGP